MFRTMLVVVCTDALVVDIDAHHHLVILQSADQYSGSHAGHRPRRLQLD